MRDLIWDKLTLGSFGIKVETGWRADMMTELIVVSPDSDSESISSTATLVPELEGGDTVTQ